MALPKPSACLEPPDHPFDDPDVLSKVPLPYVRHYRQGGLDMCGRDLGRGFIYLLLTYFFYLVQWHYLKQTSLWIPPRKRATPTP